jgi:hypothetical protein
MNNFIVKATSIALGAATLAVTATPAEAQRGRGYDRYDRHDRYDRYDRYNRRDRGGSAIAAGVAGLAIGAALSSRNRYDRGYYGDGYYYDGPRYRDSYYSYDRPYRYRGYDRGGCYTRRVWDPYYGRRVRVRYCR